MHGILHLTMILIRLTAIHWHNSDKHQTLRNRRTGTLSDLQLIDFLEHRISAHENTIHALLTDIVLHFIYIVA